MRYLRQGRLYPPILGWQSSWLRILFEGFIVSLHHRDTSDKSDFAELKKRAFYERP
jgi:hypothetical protein